MSIQVKLQDIIEGIEVQADSIRTFLNTNTGDVISVSEDNLRAAEDEEPMDHLPNWQQEDLKIAYDVVENFEDYKELPTKFEINEYEMMEDFCLTIRNEKNQALMLNLIKGKGTFRRFKDIIVQLGIDVQWYSYRDQCYKQIAMEWCQDNNVDYVE
ncbi:UPF0158 family protein [Aneurinibacillus tyrosinisolvens]|uniref:UPF0158 family protein n=1 Tax=Aneurinibacillus tyrosinisolvens TaxID=1443435 RepID=UPI00063FA569|nr:UPF0158 family protein [Aneurinibacillus tyrosinisolvens]